MRCTQNKHGLKGPETQHYIVLDDKCSSSSFQTLAIVISLCSGYMLVLAELDAFLCHLLAQNFAEGLNGLVASL